MVESVIRIMAIVSEILTIASLWGINDESSLWLKIVITIIATIFGIIVLILTYDIFDIKVKWFHEKNGNYWVYAKRSKYLVDGAIVSIYYKYMKYEEEYDELVAFGYVFTTNNSSEDNIKIIHIIDEELWKYIMTCSKSYKKLHIKPNVDYYHIMEMDMIKEMNVDV